MSDHSNLIAKHLDAVLQGLQMLGYKILCGIQRSVNREKGKSQMEGNEIEEANLSRKRRR